MNDGYPLFAQPKPPLPPFKPFFLAFLVMLGIALLLFLQVVKAEEVDMNIIATIESNSNPKAWNYTTGARGTFQITKSVLTEYNKFVHPYNEKTHMVENWHYSMDDLFNPLLNYKIASWYINTRIPQMLIHYKIPDCTDYRLMAYNWGINNLNNWFKKYAHTPQHFPKMSQESKDYIRKYHKLENANKIQ